MRKKMLGDATLACVESAYGAIRVLEKHAFHPQWRENDTWETVNQGREAIRQAFPDVRFVSHSAFQSAYRERRREEAKVLPPASHGYRVPISAAEPDLHGADLHGVDLTERPAGGTCCFQGIPLQATCCAFCTSPLPSGDANADIAWAALSGRKDE